MAQGTVKFFNEQKGYGFIVPIGKIGSSLPDVFVHMSAAGKAGSTTLSEGQVVEYTLVENRGRTQAENLKLLATPKR
jgi:cold shock protein